MGKTEICELTMLCLIRRGNEVLLQNRVKRDWAGYTLPGGHVEPGESFVEACVREMKEETGLTLTEWKFRGIVSFLSDTWPDEYMCLYTATGFTGEMITCSEGTLEWVEKNKVSELPIWEGDKIVLQLLARDGDFFSLKLRYEGEALVEAVLDGVALEV